MNAETFLKILGVDFFTGVPDSQLKALCNCLIDRYGIDPSHHIIAANEGNCTAMAAGYHLATGKIPAVYMQNSGEGNIINPLASLLNDKVYAIPCIFIIGWRGEPGIHDEPQHIFQGEVTCKLLETMQVPYMIVDKDINEKEVDEKMEVFQHFLNEGRQVAFIVRKGGITFEKKISYTNKNTMSREEIIQHITNISEKDIIVSTTGKASRELFEIRAINGQSHETDFLTVGSMGHSSSIAFEIAAQKPDRKVWIIDGDGSALMHLGSMAIMGANKLPNVVHIVINNSAHETVGGQPTVAGEIDLTAIAKGCGYPTAVCAESFESFDSALLAAKQANTLQFIEVKCAIGARDDLGRPTTTAKENKELFMTYLSR